MSRPAMRPSGGRWSLSQVHTHAGVSLAIARRVAALGWLDAADLTAADIVVLQVGAALLDAPRPGGPRTGRSTVTARDGQALALAREVTRRGGGDLGLTLVVAAEEVAVAENIVGLMNAVHSRAGSPLLLLPLGAWVRALPAMSVAPETV